MKAKTLIFQGDTVGTSEFTVRDLNDGEILAQAEYTCISPGTELRCLSGGQTDEKGAYIPGYAFVGKVIASKSDIDVGTRVYCGGTQDGGELATCWGGHTSIAITGADGCIPVPDNVDPVEASLAALGGIAYHGFLQSKPKQDENVAVIGLGVLGQISARLHAIAGANVVAADLSKARVDVSNAAGITAVCAADGLKAAVEPHQPDGATLVVDVTGVAKVIPQGIELVSDIPWTDEPEPFTRYMIQGSYADSFTVPYNDAFFKQLAFLLPRNRQTQDCKAFIDLVAEGKLKARDLVCKIVKPEDAPAAYEALRHPEETPGTIAIDWTE